jgi:hypothetical protein
MKRNVAYLLLLLAICPCIGRAQDRIEQIRQDANAQDNSSSPTQSGTDDSKKQKRNDDQNSQGCSPDVSFDDGGGAFAKLLLDIAALPISVPNWLLKDNGGGDRFLHYPYADGYGGFLQKECWPDNDDGPRSKDEELPMRYWSFRIGVEDGNDFQGMNRVGIRATVDTETRFGIQSNWNYLYESLGGGLHDQTLLGDSALTARFAQNDWIYFYAGLGARILTDPHTTDGGFNFVYGFDSFPKKPWVLSGLFDTGNVGSAWIWHGRATIGAAYKHFEVFTGYDFMRIGSVNVQGPLIGLRLWF